MRTTPIFYYDQVALVIVANHVHHDKKKHLEIDCHFIRDKAEEGVFALSYIPTSQQVADLLTKILLTEQHRVLLSEMGVYSLKLTQLLRGGVLRV